MFFPFSRVTRQLSHVRHATNHSTATCCAYAVVTWGANGTRYCTSTWRRCSVNHTTSGTVYKCVRRTAWRVSWGTSSPQHNSRVSNRVVETILLSCLPFWSVDTQQAYQIDFYTCHLDMIFFKTYSLTLIMIKNGVTVIFGRHVCKRYDRFWEEPKTPKGNLT